MARPLLVLILLAATALARDPSVGACTKKDAFAKLQAKIDPQVAKFTREESWEKKVRLAKSLTKKYGKRQIEHLIRYREPDMAMVLVPLLKSKSWPHRARALYALKMVGDTAVVKEVAAALRDKVPMVRELAANALCHMGEAAGLDALRKSVEGEKDPYVLASMRAAIEVLESHDKPYSLYRSHQQWKEPLEGPEGARRVAWEWVKKGKALFNDYHRGAVELTPATEFRYPVSWYRDSLFSSYPRNSFGAGGNHAGEDCAWFREGCSIYSIADGIVRMVQGAGGDWGFLIVVEHLLESGDYITSVYGHCAWDVLVTAGDKVTAGQKIATQGLSCSAENGGYGSHLHFGIGDGPFRRPKRFKKGDPYRYADGRDTEIVRFVYGGESRTRLTAVLRLKDGTEKQVLLPGEPFKDELAWLQAYIQGCAGWLDPESFLPGKVEGARR